MSPAVFELMALRKVSQGGVTIHDGGYVHAGRPIGGELAAALVRLQAAGHLTIGAPAPGGHRPVQTTVAGAVRLGELSRSGRHGSARAAIAGRPPVERPDKRASRGPHPI